MAVFIDSKIAQNAILKDYTDKLHLSVGEKNYKLEKRDGGFYAIVPQQEFDNANQQKAIKVVAVFN